MHRQPILMSVVISLSACGGQLAKPVSPTDGNDPAYAVTGAEQWYLVGDALTLGEDRLSLQVVTPPDVGTVHAWVGDEPAALTAGSTAFELDLDISGLPAGDHVVLLGADGADQAFAAVTVRRSHPLYVVVSTDWDDGDTPDENLDRHDSLRADHPELLLTHFLAPYTFTDPAIPAARVDELVAWAEAMRDDHGDELGLHIHPYCHFVEAAGVECRLGPTFYEFSDDPGYTVMCAAYSEAEFTTLLDEAVDLFEANGWGRPTSFRAGGWTADATVLQALANAGFVADTSAVNWARLEEWEGVEGAQLYEWNRDNWSEMGDTSQPYYPSAADPQVPGSIPVLEVPDNGALVDYVEAAEMRQIFDANLGEGPLTAPRAYSIGFHPINFSAAFEDRMDGALNRVDRYLASQDAGPAVYARLSDLALVWPAP